MADAALGVAWGPRSHLPWTRAAELRRAGQSPAQLKAKAKKEKKDAKKKKDKKEDKKPGRAHVNLWGKNRPERAKGVFSTPKSEKSESKGRSNTFFVGIGGSSLKSFFGVGRVGGPPGLAVDIPSQFGFGRMGRPPGIEFPSLFGNSPAGKARQSRGIEARRG